MRHVNSKEEQIKGEPCTNKLATAVQGSLASLAPLRVFHALTPKHSQPSYQPLCRVTTDSSPCQPMAIEVSGAFREIWQSQTCLSHFRSTHHTHNQILLCLHTHTHRRSLYFIRTSGYVHCNFIVQCCY